MDIRLACFAVVFVGSYCQPSFDAKGADGSANDFGQGQQPQQGSQVAFDPNYSADQSAFQQFQNNQRLASNSFFPGQQGLQQPGLPQQPTPQQWNGEMADLSQVLTQNVVANQVSQLQQGQPDPLSASPYQALLKNLAGTAPLYPPVAPGTQVGADSRFPGQILGQGPLEGQEVERLEPPGPPHPPLNVENANYLTAVASIPQRIGVNAFNPSSLPGAFPHQTFLPNINYMNRGQQAPPAFNPWPAQLQSGQIQQQQQTQLQSIQQQQQQQQQQIQQQQQQQQHHVGAQLRNMPVNPSAQRHPSQSIRAASNERNPVIDVTENSTVSTDSKQGSKVNRTNNGAFEENLKNYLTQQIQDMKIVSYGQSSCQLCDNTDKILRNYKLPIHSFQMDTMVGGDEILQILQKLTASKDIPYVFVCGHYVGGYRKVQDLHTQDELKTLMKRCTS